MTTPYTRTLRAAAALLVLFLAGGSHAVSPTLQYSNELSYDITHDQNITWTPTGNPNDDIDLKIFVPAPLAAGWPEQGGPTNEAVIETPDGALALGHSNDVTDTEYLAYVINYQTKQTTKLGYTYTIALRNTTLAGGSFDDIEATLNQSSGEGGYGPYKANSSTIESAHADMVQLKSDILTNAGLVDPNTDLTKDVVKAFYQWIHGHMTYDTPYPTGYEGSGKLTKYAGPFYNGNYSGQCGDYAAILVTLCRAAGIPARVVTGHIVGGAANHYHVWAEIHFFGVAGWVPADPQADQGPPSGYWHLGQFGSGNKRLVMGKGADMSLNPGGHSAPLLQNNLWSWSAPGDRSHTPSVSSVVSSVLATNTRTIAASVSGEGSISPPGNVLVVLNANQPFTYSPANGNYKLDDVLVDGASVGTPANYQFNNVVANHTIRAVFVIDQAAYDGDGDGNADAGEADTDLFATPGSPGCMTTVVCAGATGFNPGSGHIAKLADAPASTAFPYGFIDYTATGLVAGNTYAMTVCVPRNTNITGYWKKHRITGVYGDIATGVTHILGPPSVTRVNFSITEGGPYDDDGLQNGIIQDPGGPGYGVTVAAGGSSALGSSNRLSEMTYNDMTATAVPYGGEWLTILLAGGCGLYALRRRH